METEVRLEASSWKLHVPDAWKIQIPRELYDKIYMYVKCIDKEIAGFGNVEVDNEKKLYVISELMMFKQKVSGASVDFSQEHLGEMLSEAMASGQDLSKTKFEWHSHANMSVFWSQTDEECCKTLVNCSRDFYVFFVVNKKGELLSRVDYIIPFMGKPMQITNLNVPVIIQEPVSTQLEEIVRADISKYIDQTVAHSYGACGGYSGHTHDDDPQDRRYTPNSSDQSACIMCHIVERHTRWAAWSGGWTCKECDDEHDKKMEKEKDTIALCNTCKCSCRREYSMLHNKVQWWCSNCQKISDDPMIVTRSHEEDGHPNIITWSKCEKCGEDTYTRHCEIEDMYMCDKCFTQARRARKRANVDNASWCDDKGRWWFWNKCQICDNGQDDYVTWNVELQQRICEDCLDKQEEKV